MLNIKKQNKTKQKHTKYSSSYDSEKSYVKYICKVLFPSYVKQKVK